MYQPESYAIALAFMIVTMLCWGSWANTLKLTPGYRFQLFYWDYVIGLVVGAIAWGLTLGSMGTAGLALVVGAVSSYLLAPKGNPLMLFGGVALVVAAIICDAAAYRAREATKQAA